MSEREFPEVSIPYGGTATKAMKIQCASCEGVAYYPHQTGVNRKPPVAAVQHFRNKGWSVGNGPKKDLCPECVKRGKPKRKPEMNDMSNAPAAEPPREMSREDRRIINDKLDEVYGTGGYKTPWTDAAVAKDLGVPREWVSQTRDAFFGPAGSNPLFDDYLSQRDAVVRMAADVVAVHDEATKALAKCNEAVAGFRKKLDEVSALGRRVEREIGR